MQKIWGSRRIKTPLVQYQSNNYHLKFFDEPTHAQQLVLQGT